VLQIGLAGGRPNANDARDHAYAGFEPARQRPLVIWADVFGAQAGDQQYFRLEGPEGVVFDRRNTLEASNVSWFAFNGARPPDGGWPAGPYTGRYWLIRDGVRIAEEELRFSLK